MTEILTVPPRSLDGFAVPPGVTAVCFVPPESAASGISAAVEVAEGGSFFFRSLSIGDSGISLSVRLVGKNARADVRGAVIGAADGTSGMAADVSCRADGTTASVRIAALAPDASKIDTRATVSVESGVVGAEVESLQSNVFLGKSGSIRGMPELRVSASEVKARHACSVDRVSEESLFYLRSRGLSAHDATASLLSAKVSEIFAGLPEGFVHDGEAMCAKAMSSAIGK